MEVHPALSVSPSLVSASLPALAWLVSLHGASTHSPCDPSPYVCLSVHAVFRPPQSCLPLEMAQLPSHLPFWSRRPSRATSSTPCCREDSSSARGWRSVCIPPCPVVCTSKPSRPTRSSLRLWGPNGWPRTCSCTGTAASRCRTDCHPQGKSAPAHRRKRTSKGWGVTQRVGRLPPALTGQVSWCTLLIPALGR